MIACAIRRICTCIDAQKVMLSQGMYIGTDVQTRSILGYCTPADRWTVYLHGLIAAIFDCLVKVQWSAISLKKHHTAAIVVASAWTRDTRAAKPFGYSSNALRFGGLECQAAETTQTTRHPNVLVVSN